MPRANTEQKNERVKVADSVSNAELQEVNAKPLDMLEIPKASTKLDGLLDGLKEINPKLNRFAYYRGRVEAKEDKQHGITLGTTGKPLPEDASDVMRHSYLGTLGDVNAHEYALEIREKFYSRDKNDLSDEEWFKKATENTQAQYDGMDSSYTVAFAKVIKPKLIELQREALKTKLEDITLKGEENLGKMITQQLDELKKQPSSMGAKTAIWNNINFRGKSMGLPRESIRAVKLSLMEERAHVGDTTLIELSKQDREGGEAGMYYSGQNKIKIDGYSRIAGNFHQKDQKKKAAIDAAEEKTRTDPIRIQASLIAIMEGPRKGVSHLLKNRHAFTDANVWNAAMANIGTAYSNSDGDAELYDEVREKMLISGELPTLSELANMKTLNAKEQTGLLTLSNTMRDLSATDLARKGEETRLRRLDSRYLDAIKDINIEVTGTPDGAATQWNPDPDEFNTKLARSAINRLHFAMEGKDLDTAAEVSSRIMKRMKEIKLQHEKIRDTDVGKLKIARLRPDIIYHSRAAISEAIANYTSNPRLFPRITSSVFLKHKAYFDEITKIEKDNTPSALLNKEAEAFFQKHSPNKSESE